MDPKTETGKKGKSRQQNKNKTQCLISFIFQKLLCGVYSFIHSSTNSLTHRPICRQAVRTVCRH